jgi:type IV secretory pathway TrbD component
MVRSAGERSRSFLRKNRPIAREVFERLKRWVILLNRRLERSLQKRVPRSQQQLLQVIIQVIAVIALLLLLPYSLYILIGVGVVLWVQAARDLKREAKTDQRLLRQAEAEADDFDY